MKFGNFLNSIFKKNSGLEHFCVIKSDINVALDKQICQDSHSKKKPKISKGAVKCTSTSATGKKKLSVKKASALGHLDQSGMKDGIALILKQLQNVNDRLDLVEKK